MTRGGVCVQNCHRSNSHRSVSSYVSASLIAVVLCACGGGGGGDSAGDAALPMDDAGGSGLVDAGEPKLDAGSDASKLTDSGTPTDPALCGNRKLDPGEMCDDGNQS